MASKNKLQPTTMQTFDTSTLTGSYQVVATDGFDTNLAVLKIYNTGTSDITVSYDGTTDQDVYPASSTFVLDVQANKEGDRAAWPAKREIFVKGSATAGILYIVGYSIRG